jgi:hypothetical protein
MSLTKKGCPKGVPNSDCPGKGEPQKCHYYDSASGKCYYLLETMDITYVPNEARFRIILSDRYDKRDKVGRYL